LPDFFIEIPSPLSVDEAVTQPKVTRRAALAYSLKDAPVLLAE
jgi:hypothetical protein